MQENKLIKKLNIVTLTTITITLLIIVITLFIN